MEHYGVEERHLAVVNGDVPPFLSDLTFQLVGFPETQQGDLSAWITEAQGEIVYSDHGDPLNYLLEPVAGVAGELPPHHNLVSEVWLDCLDEGKLMSPPLYHHRALALGPARQLEGVVTCLSGYYGRERDFLHQLVVGLGGVAQEIFAKRGEKVTALEKEIADIKKTKEVEEVDMKAIKKNTNKLRAKKGQF